MSTSIDARERADDVLPPVAVLLEEGAAELLATERAARKPRGWAEWVLYVVLGAGAIAMVFPFLWMIATSLKFPQDLYNLRLIPDNPTLGNYRYVLSATPFGRWFVNSLVVATVTTVSVLFFDSITGYALAKFNFPGRQVIFVVILSTLMVPTEMLVIPWYMLSTRMNWVDSYWGIMFPGVMTAFGVFLMRQFFQSVPDDLLDAARIDGLSEFGIYWRIALPLVKPALAALAIFTFLGNWNAYLWPLIVIRSREMQTLPVGVSLFSSEAGSDYQYIMAAASLATIPVLIVFMMFQRQIIRGIALTGLKG